MKTITCIGGIADGKVVNIEDSIQYILFPYIDSEIAKRDLLKHSDPDYDWAEDIIGWDDYGPIFKHPEISQVKYEVIGDKAYPQKGDK